MCRWSEKYRYTHQVNLLKLKYNHRKINHNKNRVHIWRFVCSYSAVILCCDVTGIVDEQTSFMLVCSSTIPVTSHGLLTWYSEAVLAPSSSLLSCGTIGLDRLILNWNFINQLRLDWRVTSTHVGRGTVHAWWPWWRHQMEILSVLLALVIHRSWNLKIVY